MRCVLLLPLRHSLPFSELPFATSQTVRLTLRLPAIRLLLSKFLLKQFTRNAWCKIVCSFAFSASVFCFNNSSAFCFYEYAPALSASSFATFSISRSLLSRSRGCSAMSVSGFQNLLNCFLSFQLELLFTRRVFLSFLLRSFRECFAVRFLCKFQRLRLAQVVSSTIPPRCQLCGV